MNIGIYSRCSTNPWTTVSVSRDSIFLVQKLPREKVWTSDGLFDIHHSMTLLSAVLCNSPCHATNGSVHAFAVKSVTPLQEPFNTAHISLQLLFYIKTASPCFQFLVIWHMNKGRKRWLVEYHTHATRYNQIEQRCHNVAVVISHFFQILVNFCQGVQCLWKRNTRASGEGNRMRNKWKDAIFWKWYDVICLERSII